MASVRLSVADFESGRLPQVCALSGARTGGGELAVFAKNPIGAGWLLLFLGVIPLLIWRSVTRKTAAGVLPVSNLAYARLQETRRRRGRWVLACWLAMGAFVVAAFAASSGVVGSIVVVPLVFCALTGFVVASFLGSSRHWVPFTAVVDTSGRWVHFRHVDDHFAAAVEGLRRFQAAEVGAPVAMAPAPWTVPAFTPPLQRPAGWYPDPLQPTRRRYWDGGRWADSIA